MSGPRGGAEADSPICLVWKVMARGAGADVQIQITPEMPQISEIGISDGLKTMVFLGLRGFFAAYRGRQAAKAAAPRPPLQDIRRKIPLSRRAWPAAGL